MKVKRHNDNNSAHTPWSTTQRRVPWLLDMSIDGHCSCVWRRRSQIVPYNDVMVVRAVGRHIKQSARATYPRTARFTGNYISISVRLYCCHKVSALDYDCLLSRPKYNVIVPYSFPTWKLHVCTDFCCFMQHSFNFMRLHWGDSLSRIMLSRCYIY